MSTALLWVLGRSGKVRTSTADSAPHGEYQNSARGFVVYVVEVISGPRKEEPSQPRNLGIVVTSSYIGALLEEINRSLEFSSK